MRIFYCFEVEENKCVTEIVDTWLYTLDKVQKETIFCFEDTDGDTYKLCEKVPYGYALKWLRTIAENGYINLENYIFELEENE